MIGNLIRVMMEHPMLMLVFLADLALISLITYYIVSHVFGKKRIDLKLRAFLSRFFVRFRSHNIEGIEPLYEFVIDTYVRKGIVHPDMGRGFRAREKVLESTEGEERRVVQAIFDSYESKKYGGGVWNEEKTVSTLLDKFRAL